MAWDTARTRAALLTAATAEFSEFGFSGARIERISLRAEVNRERLYSYFGNKQKLFEAVLAGALTSSFESIAVEGTGAAAIGDFAGRYFDAVQNDPSLARLIMWEALELGGAVDASARSARAEEKVAAFREVHPALSANDARLLMISIVALVNTWLQSRNLREIIVGQTDGAAEWRAWLVRSVTRLAESPEE
jgi:AcrR family transcriptional regulator